MPGGLAQVDGYDGFYLQPTLLHSPSGSNCNPNEIFHTFVNVQSVTSLEEPVEYANNTPYGLGSSIWTQDMELGQRIAKQFRDGTGQVNCHNTNAYGFPYSGQGISGGPGAGVNCEETIRDYLQVKSIFVTDYSES